MKDSGSLVITTSHTHARYVLPQVIRSFMDAYPKVAVTLRQGNPTQIATWVSAGEADLCISSQPVHAIPDLVLLPCYDHPKIILAPVKHPLLSVKKVSIRQLARYPLITYDAEFSTHSQIMETFRRNGLTPNVILRATDVDVMKTYVKEGFGIAIVGALAYRKELRIPLLRVPTLLACAENDMLLEYLPRVRELLPAAESVITRGVGSAEAAAETARAFESFLDRQQR